MIIVRILNNNVVQAVTATSGKEAVIMGKGLAYGKKTGDQIDPEDGEKVFELSNTFASEHISSLLDEVPAEYWEFTLQMTDYIENELSIRLSASFYFALLDHIYIAIKRYRENIVLPEIYMMETKYLYENEFRVAVEIVKKMEAFFQCDLGNGEAGFIAMHIIDACSEWNNVSNKDVSKLVNTIVHSVEEEYTDRINKESIDYSRFTVHLKYLAQRVVSKKLSKNNEMYIPIIKSLKKDYEKQYALVKRITLVINSMYQYEVSEEEQCYLLIHLIKITTK